MSSITFAGQTQFAGGDVQFGQNWLQKKAEEFQLKRVRQQASTGVRDPHSAERELRIQTELLEIARADEQAQARAAAMAEYNLFMKKADTRIEAALEYLREQIELSKSDEGRAHEALTGYEAQRDNIDNRYQAQLDAKQQAVARLIETLAQQQQQNIELQTSYGDKVARAESVLAVLGQKPGLDEQA